MASLGWLRLSEYETRWDDGGIERHGEKDEDER